MRKRTFSGIAQQHHAINHAEHALYFAAKIGVAGGVHDVDAQITAGYAGAFGENGNAAFFFQIAGIHDAGVYVLVGAKGAALLEHLVDEGGFAMIHVSNDGDVTNMFHGESFSYALLCGVFCLRLGFP